MSEKKQDEGAALSAIGARLREKRVQLGWGIEDVSHQLRVEVRILEAIENGWEAPNNLPEVIYKGFARNYARLLGIEWAHSNAGIPNIASLLRQDAMVEQIATESVSVTSDPDLGQNDGTNIARKGAMLSEDEAFYRRQRFGLQPVVLALVLLLGGGFIWWQWGSSLQDALFSDSEPVESVEVVNPELGRMTIQLGQVEQDISVQQIEVDRAHIPTGVSENITEEESEGGFFAFFGNLFGDSEEEKPETEILEEISEEVVELVATQQDKKDRDKDSDDVQQQKESEEVPTVDIDDETAGDVQSSLGAEQEPAGQSLESAEDVSAVPSISPETVREIQTEPMALEAEAGISISESFHAPALINTQAEAVKEIGGVDLGSQEEKVSSLTVQPEPQQKEIQQPVVQGVLDDPQVSTLEERTSPILVSMPELLKRGLTTSREPKEILQREIITIPRGKVEIVYQESAWTRVEDGLGRQLVKRMFDAGTRKAFEGALPLEVALGNAAGVVIYFNDKLFDHLNYIEDDNTARFILGEEE